MQATSSKFSDISNYPVNTTNPINSHGLTIKNPLPPELMDLLSHYEWSILGKILDKWTDDTSSKGSLSFGFTKKFEKCSSDDASKSILSFLFKEPVKDSIDISYEHPDLLPLKTSIIFGYNKKNKPVVSRVIQYLHDKNGNIFPHSMPFSNNCTLPDAINIEIIDILRQVNRKYN
jgi:hypothetical protein